MNITQKMALAAAVAIPFSVSSAGVVVTPEPGGMSTLTILSGSAGVSSNPSSWFVGENGASIYTYWAGDPLTYTAVLPPSEDAWRLGVTAMNVGGPLDPGYSSFNVSVSVNGSSVGTLAIAASDSAWSTAWIDLGYRAGLTHVTLAWQNDAWNPGVSDANISYGALQFASRSIPTPGTGSLAAIAFVVFAGRVRRAPGAVTNRGRRATL